MKKIYTYFGIFVLVLSLNCHQMLYPEEQSICTFIFPSSVKYRIERFGHPAVSCSITYKKRSHGSSLSELEMILSNPGNTGRFMTLFSEATQIVIESYVYEGEEISSQLIWQHSESILSYKKKRRLFFSEPKKNKCQMELFADFQLVDTLLCFYLASKRVAECAYRENKQYSFFTDGSEMVDCVVKNVFMVHLGAEETPYNGRPVPTELMALTFNNRLIFEMNIHTDQNGYTYPIKITIKDPHQNNKNALQLKATQITPPPPQTIQKSSR